MLTIAVHILRYISSYLGLKLASLQRSPVSCQSAGALSLRLVVRRGVRARAINKVGGAQQPRAATHVASVSGSLKRLVVSTSCPLYKRRVSYIRLGMSVYLLSEVVQPERTARTFQVA